MGFLEKSYEKNTGFEHNESSHNSFENYLNKTLRIDHEDKP